MRYNVRKNWFASIELIRTRPVILLPFIGIAFLECLALELIYFAARPPISFISSPLISKFFGEVYMHYPGNPLLLPKLFYYAQVVIYIFAGVLLAGMAVNIFKNIKTELPLRSDAVVKNGFRRYAAFFSFAVIVIVLTFLMKKADMFIFFKAFRLAANHIPQEALKLTGAASAIFLFLTDMVMQAFIMLAVPIMVIKNKPMFRSLASSVYMAARNFPALFTLISLPFLGYLPVMLLKAESAAIANKTSPEINLYITLLGIAFSVFIDSFIVVCASQFLLDKDK